MIKTKLETGGRGQAGHSLCSNSLFERLRAQACGLLDTKAGVCPTPIFSPVAKGHAPPAHARP